LVGTKYIVIPSNQRIPEGYFGPDSVTIVQNFPGGQLLKNDNAFPRVFLTDSVRVIEDVSAIDTQVLRGQDNLRHLVYLEKQPGIDLSDSTVSGDSAWVESYATDSVLVGINSQNNSILVLTDNYYEAWKVYIDGNMGEIYRADGSFRAVPVPAGTKAVLFKYESAHYATGKTITVVALVYLLLVFIYFLLMKFAPGLLSKKSD